MRLSSTLRVKVFFAAVVACAAASRPAASSAAISAAVHAARSGARHDRLADRISDDTELLWVTGGGNPGAILLRQTVVKRLLFSLGTAFERRRAFGCLGYRLQHQPAGRWEADAELLDSTPARYRIRQSFKLDSVAFPDASMVVILAG